MRHSPRFYTFNGLRDCLGRRQANGIDQRMEPYLAVPHDHRSSGALRSGAGHFDATYRIPPSGIRLLSFGRRQARAASKRTAPSRDRGADAGFCRRQAKPPLDVQCGTFARCRIERAAARRANVRHHVSSSRERTYVTENWLPAGKTRRSVRSAAPALSRTLCAAARRAKRRHYVSTSGERPARCVSMRE
ncbi:hypothetical protein DFH06DRAFT_1480207 [Mycena polygramma]|nr:hypothetical protein DFH06DRAFT_1480207 [Mycena polygramma]